MSPTLVLTDFQNLKAFQHTYVFLEVTSENISAYLQLFIFGVAYGRPVPIFIFGKIWPQQYRLGQVFIRFLVTLHKNLCFLTLFISSDSECFPVHKAKEIWMKWRQHHHLYDKMYLMAYLVLSFGHLPSEKSRHNLNFAKNMPLNRFQSLEPSRKKVQTRPTLL